MIRVSGAGKKCVVLFWFCVLFMSIQAQQPASLARQYNVASMQADFYTLYFNLTRANPGAYRFITPRALDSSYHTLYSHINHPENALQFKMHCDSLVALIRCGHTGLYYNRKLSKQMLKDKVYRWELGMIILHNHVYIYEDRIDADTLFKPGLEILSINRVPATAIINKDISLMPPDGFSPTSLPTHGSPYIPIVFMSSFWDGKDSLHFILADSTGKQVQANISLARLCTTAKREVKEENDQDTGYRRVWFGKKKPAAKKKNFSISPFAGPSLKVSLRDSSMAVMTIPIFLFNTRFFANAFKYLSDHHITNLVLDLRGNPGGQIVDATALLSYLLDTGFSYQFTRYNKPLSEFTGIKNKGFVNLKNKLVNQSYPHYDSSNVRVFTGRQTKNKKVNHFNGHLVVLINGGTFSASCIVAAYLSDQNRALFVGRESGGARYGCNAVVLPAVQMPNTPIMLRLPLYSILYHIQDKGNGRGIMPDYPVDYNIGQLVNKSDPDVLKAISLFKAWPVKTQ